MKERGGEEEMQRPPGERKSTEMVLEVESGEATRKRETERKRRDEVS